jgi:ribosomal protein S27E
VRGLRLASVAPLTVCPSCGSRLLQPLRSRPRSSDEVLVDLRCPECELWMQGCFSKADAEALDRLQAACRDQIVSAYEASVSESMRTLAFNLATALELDLLSADDFAPPKARPRPA